MKRREDGIRGPWRQAVASLNRILALVLLICLGTVSSLWAQDRFDEDRLTPSDARFLQAALSFSGFYLGRIDGDWGGRSREGLSRATGNEASEAAVLRALLPLMDELAQVSWESFDPTGATSMLMPMSLMNSVEGDDFIEFSTASRDLIIRYIFRATRGAAAMHDWLEREHIGPRPFYRAETREAFISGGRVETGEVYLRSVFRNDVWETVLVQYRPAQESRGRLVVASLTNGSVAPLRIPAGGYISRMLTRSGNTTAPPADPVARPDAPGAGAGATGVTGTGTGFYVNGTDIVTAAHVTTGCSRLTLADGSALLLLQADQARDLAVLRAARRSDDWLDLASGGSLRLGAPVVTIGYPYAGLFDQGLSVTRGNISALRGIDGSPDALMLTAPVQPGNSGGPLLDQNGRVIGVVTYRASDGYTLERSGTLAQNLNGATQLKPLRTFLGAAGVALPPPTELRHDLGSGLPDALTRAVVALQCFGHG